MTKRLITIVGANGVKQKYDLAIEALHLWTDHDLRQKNRYYEVWIPVELK